jgi:hypothetical protein
MNVKCLPIVRCIYCLQVIIMEHQNLPKIQRITHSEEPTLWEHSYQVSTRPPRANGGETGQILKSLRTIDRQLHGRRVICNLRHLRGRSPWNELRVRPISDHYHPTGKWPTQKMGFHIL